MASLVPKDPLAKAPFDWTEHIRQTFLLLEHVLLEEGAVGQYPFAHIQLSPSTFCFLRSSELVLERTRAVLRLRIRCSGERYALYATEPIDGKTTIDDIHDTFKRNIATHIQTLTTDLYHQTCLPQFEPMWAWPFDEGVFSDSRSAYQYVIRCSDWIVKFTLGKYFAAANRRLQSSKMRQGTIQLDGWQSAEYFKWPDPLKWLDTLFSSSQVCPENVAYTRDGMLCSAPQEAEPAEVSAKDSTRLDKDHRVRHKRKK